MIRPNQKQIPSGKAGNIADPCPASVTFHENGQIAKQLGTFVIKF